MKDKILQLVNNFVSIIKPKLVVFDSKVSGLIPNPKIKKTVYISVGSLFGFMFLIIIFGIILSLFKNQDQTSGTILNKPNVIVTSPKPQTELSETEKQILNLENRIKELRFPESILNIPQIEKDLII